MNEPLYTHNAQQHFKYSYGDLYCFEHYVIGIIKEGERIDTTKTIQILGDLKSHYKHQPYIYISNRTFDHEIDLAVYKLIDPKKLIGIAIVSNKDTEVNRALQEQSHYKGSFGLFKSMESAVAWARTFSMAI